MPSEPWPGGCQPVQKCLSAGQWLASSAGSQDPTSLVTDMALTGASGKRFHNHTTTHTKPPTMYVFP